MKHLHPRAVWLLFLSGGSMASFLSFVGFFYLGIIFYSVMAAGAASTGVSLTSTLVPYFLLIIPLAVIAKYLWAYFSWKFYKYELREDGFRKEHGIIWKKYVSIPYNRIQNVDIYRGLLARLLGLSDIQIQTAGGITVGSYGAFSEGRLLGIGKEEAEQLRDELIRRARTDSTQAPV